MMKGNKNMNEKHFATYTAEIRAEFGPEWSPLGHKAAKEHVARLKKKKDAWIKKSMEAERNYIRYKTDENRRVYDDYQKKAEAALRELDKAEKLLDTGEVYGTMAPVEHTNYIACDSEISLADLYDIRHDTNGKAPRIVAERYDDTAAASAADEGNTIDKIDFADCVNTFAADYDSITKLDSIEVIPEDYIMDDPELGYVAFNNLRFKHLRSAENTLLCQEIIGSKAAVSLSTAADLLTLPALSAKARRGAEIITNETGFAKLDVSDPVSGETYIKKNFQIGEFVYRDRYIIRVLPDEILANYENDTAPVLLGDWKNILRLAVVTERAAEHTDIVAFTVEARTIRREVPILTTTSDKAYFVGAIA